MKILLTAAALLLAASSAAAQKSPGAQPDSTVAYELHEVRVLPRPIDIPEPLGRRWSRRIPSPCGTRRSAARSRCGCGSMRRVPHDLKVMTSTHAEFEAPTLQVMQVLQFTPGMIDGRPVKTWVELPIQWMP